MTRTGRSVGVLLAPLRRPDRPWALVSVGCAWVVSRTLMLSLGLCYGPERFALGDLASYYRWGHAMARNGGLTLHGWALEYPAGAAPFVAPGAAGGPVRFLELFVLRMLVVDALLVVTLVVAGRRWGSLDGAWMWLLATTVLGPVALTRFDPVSCLFAVAGLTAAVVDLPLLAGALLSLGAAVKIWPAVLLLPVLLVVRRRGRLLAGAAGAAVGAAGLVAAAGGGIGALTSVVRYQDGRGLQVESLLALPWMWLRALGAGGRVAEGYSSVEVSGPGSAVAVALATSLEVAVLAAAAAVLWRHRAALRVAGIDGVSAAGALLVTGLLLGDRVLSAQYLLWLVALVGLALSRRPGVARDAAVPLVAAAALTHVVYPLSYLGLLRGGVVPVLVLTLRDVLLVLVALRLVGAVRRMPAERSSSAPGSRGPTPILAAG